MFETPLSSSSVLRVAARLLVTLPASVLRCGLYYASHVLVVAALVLAALHRLGALKRIVKWRAEVEIGKLANDARITVGDLHVDVVGGRVIATDFIVHSSKRDEWMWDSPLVARIGRIDVRLNIPSVIDGVGPALGFPCKDIHSVVAEDIQVFVEKRRNVFNFHLLDPSLDLPDAGDVLESMGVKRAVDGGDGVGAAAVAGGEVVTDEEGGGGGIIDLPGGQDGSALRGGIDAPHHPRGGHHAASIAAEAKANEIVAGLAGAVSSVGRAATGSGANGESLVTALMNQKAGFVGQLRQFQARLEGGGGGLSALPEAIPEDGEVDHHTGGGSTGNNGTSQQRTAYTKKGSDLESLAKDGVKVIQQMGKVLGRNVAEMKEQADTFQPPPKKEGWVDPPMEDKFRFGRIVVRDARIFTKDMIGGAEKAPSSSATSEHAVVPDGGGTADGDGALSAKSHFRAAAHAVTIAASGGKSSAPAALAQEKKEKHYQHRPSPSGWAEPILIRELAVSGAELCPSMTAKEDDARGSSSGSDAAALPELGLKIDRVLEIVVARLLAETAKGNTGRLLNNAFGEVCTWMERKGGGTQGEAAASSQRHLGSGTKSR